MPSDRKLLALKDILDNIRHAQDFLGLSTPDDLKADRRTFYAVSRCLEIISEAARRLPAEVRDRNPNLPWRAIMGLGNIYRHDYDNVVEAMVWRTVNESLPQLASIVDDEIIRAVQESQTDG